MQTVAILTRDPYRFDEVIGSERTRTLVELGEGAREMLAGKVVVNVPKGQKPGAHTVSVAFLGADAVKPSKAKPVGFVVTNGSNKLGRRSSGTPGPLSRTQNSSGSDTRVA